MLYLGLLNDKPIDWDLASSLGGTAIGSVSMAFWLFSMKMWALSVQLISISKKEDPHAKDCLFKFLYYFFLMANFVNGLLEGLSQKYYDYLIL